MSKELAIGITEGGILHTDRDLPLTLEDKFRMVKEAGVYDYIDKTPASGTEDDYLRASDTFELPVRAGGWFYTLGSDEGLLKSNLELGARLGSVVHNTQIKTFDAQGRMVTNEEVAEIYLRATDWGEACGCLPCFEVHVNMWSEDFRRVNEVADLVEARGVPFRMTYDQSHVIFKIDNPKELQVQNIAPAVESGDLVLDPFADGNVCKEWIERGLIWHAHARAAAPNNPVNVWARHDDGTYGRGIQYPFLKPGAGEWHSEWNEDALEPWKEGMRLLLRYHARNAASPLGQVSTEFIIPTDYGAGAKYSIFEHSVACAQWLRETWDQILQEFPSSEGSPE